jgi:phenol 2-monooxygenase
MKITLRHLLDEESVPNDLTTIGGIKSGLYRSSLISAEEEERL